MKDETAIATVGPTAIQQAASLVDVIARVAMTPGADVEKLERLLAMQERVIADQREQAFMAAMSRLQAALPQMNKYGQAKNSKFARLEDIDRVIRPLLAAEGFSFSFDEESHTDKAITFIAVLSHTEGHSEAKRLTVPIDAAARNREGHAVRPAIQDAGSTVSYARRYLIKMHLNIVETNEDDDGQGGDRPITTEQALTINTMLSDTKSDKARFLKLIAGVERIEDIPSRDYRRVLNALEEKARQQR